MKLRLKQLIKNIKSLLGIIFYLIMIVVIFYIGFILMFPKKYDEVSKYKTFVVVTDSMSPKIEPMSLIVVDKYPDTNYTVNDIITFKHDIHNDGEIFTVTHRIAKIVDNAGEGISYQTRPEDKGKIDPWLIPENKVVGRVVLIIPMLGLLVLGLFEVGFLLIIIFDLMIILLLLQTFLRWKYFNDK